MLAATCSLPSRQAIRDSASDTKLTASLGPNEPGYFVLGAKSRARDSAFLMRDGFEQIRHTFAAILGNPRLDLYAKKAA